MSYRTQIAAAVKAALLDQTAAGQRVFTAMDRPLSPADLPAVMIYTLASQRGTESYGNTIIPRVVTVHIEAAAQAEPVLALDAAEAMATAIEAAVEADPTLGNVVQDTTWQRTMTDTSSHGEMTLGVALLEYQVSMLTERLAHIGDDDGFTTPPTLVKTNPHPITIDWPETLKPGPGDLCGPDGCNIPSWGGEVSETSTPAAVMPVIPTLADIAQYRTSPTTWIGIPYGDAEWDEPTLNGKRLKQVYDLYLPWEPKPGDSIPVVGRLHANGGERFIEPGSMLDNQLMQPALAAGMAVALIEFRHPVTNKNWNGLGDVPHEDVGLAVQHIRSLHAALGLDRASFYFASQSRGNLAAWQAMQANRANPNAPTYAGRQSTLFEAGLGVNLQSEFRSQRFCEQYIIPEDWAVVLASNPDDPRFGSTYLSVATAPKRPKMIVYHDNPYFGRLIAASEIIEGGVHHPDFGLSIKKAYEDVGDGDNVAICDSVTGGVETFGDFIPWLLEIRKGASAVEALTTVRTRRRGAVAYFVPKDGTGAYASQSKPSAIGSGALIGAIVDGSYGRANRTLGVNAQGIYAGQTQSARRPMLVRLQSGQYTMRFGADSALIAKMPSDGTPYFTAWTNLGEVSAYTSASATQFSFGAPQIATADVSLVLASDGQPTANDMKVYRQFAKSLAGRAYP
jgi:hypothetical protein